MERPSTIIICTAPRSSHDHLALDLVRSGEGYERVPATAEWTAAGIALHAKRPEKTWSLSDSIPFAVMRDRGIRQALAYDHHFEQAGFEALLRRDPP